MAQLKTIPFLWNVKAVRLISEDYTKKFVMGTSWSILQISCTFMLESAVNQTGELRFGVCQGTVDPYASNTCADFVGVRIGNAATWTITAGPPAYFSVTSSTAAVRKQGTTVTASAASTTMTVGAYHTYRRSNLVVRITKGSPNYSLLSYCSTSAAQAQTDSVPSTFLANAQAATPATNVSAVLAATNLAYSGAALMDSVNVSWSGLVPIYIDRIAVVRLG